MSFKISARRKVGTTTLALPIFGFGAAHLGELYSYVEEAESQSTLAAAWTGNLRSYDTAPWYGRGKSEHRLGIFPVSEPAT